MDYYKPHSRWKVLELLSVSYPADCEKFRKMPTRQLFAIYHSVQKRRLERHDYARNSETY